jgi:hypothetical protein
VQRRIQLHICTGFKIERVKTYASLNQQESQRATKKGLVKEKYPMDRSRNGGAKPRNMEVSRDKMLFSENNGSTMEKPKEEKC